MGRPGPFGITEESGDRIGGPTGPRNWRGPLAFPVRWWGGWPGAGHGSGSQQGPSSSRRRWFPGPRSSAGGPVKQCVDVRGSPAIPSRKRGGIPSGQSRLLALGDGRDRAGTGGGRSRVGAVHHAAWRRRHGAGRVRLRVAVLLRRVGRLGLGSGRDRRLRGYSLRRCGRGGSRWPRAVSWPGHGRWRVRRLRYGGARPDCARGFSVRRWSG
jgi:hypothetical protein